jgi:hypothetical protein
MTMFTRGTFSQGLSWFTLSRLLFTGVAFRMPRAVPESYSFYGNSVTRGVVRGFGFAASPVSLITCVISPLSSSAIVIM